VIDASQQVILIARLRVHFGYGTDAGGHSGRGQRIKAQNRGDRRIDAHVHSVHNPSMRIGIWNQRDHSLAQGPSQLLVVNEEEQLVLLDRSAEAAAKLVLPERGLDAVEKIASVESAVA